MESIRELFRIGNGPSSSHSMGPRRAADEVIEAMRKTGADLHEAYRETGTGGLAGLASSPQSLIGNECA